MTPDRVEDLVNRVRRLLGEPTGPNIGGVIELLKDLQLPREYEEKIMGDMKQFFNVLLAEILREMKVPKEEIE